MAPKKSTLFNMLLTLFVISILSAISLSYVYEITKEPIKKAKKEKMLKAIKKVLPEFDNNLMEYQIKIPSKIDTVRIFPAYKSDEFQAAAVTGLTDKGYNGLIKIMIGFNADSTIRNIRVLEQKETPGLGTKMKDSSFVSQYIGKNPAHFNLKVKKDGGEVDALSGATITTRAFSDAVQMAYDKFVKLKSKLTEKQN